MIYLLHGKLGGNSDCEGEEKRKDTKIGVGEGWDQGRAVSGDLVLLVAVTKKQKRFKGMYYLPMQIRGVSHPRTSPGEEYTY